MKVNIKNAAPILHRNSGTPRHIHSYSVSGWEVQGTYLIDEKGCECLTKSFDLNIAIQKMEVSNTELIENVKERLK